MKNLSFLAEFLVKLASLSRQNQKDSCPCEPVNQLNYAKYSLKPKRIGNVIMKLWQDRGTSTKYAGLV